MNQLIVSILLTLLPLVELRGGLPVALIYAKNNAVSPILVFFIIIFLNILLIFFTFFFLDYIHKLLLKNKHYNKFFNKYLKSTQKKVDKFEKNYSSIGFWALTLLVAVPLPLTGAYSGSILAWLLDLDRKKSILAISLGVVIAGLIIYAATLGILSIK